MTEDSDLKNTEAAAIVMERDALISPATSSVLSLRVGMTPFLCAGSFSYAPESVETIPFTIDLKTPALATREVAHDSDLESNRSQLCSFDAASYFGKSDVP